MRHTIFTRTIPLKALSFALPILLLANPAAATDDNDRHQFETEGGRVIINSGTCIFESKTGDHRAVAGKRLTQVQFDGRSAIVFPNRRVQNITIRYINREQENEIIAFSQTAREACQKHRLELNQND